MGSRRGHGEGAIYQRESDGLWVGSVDLGYVNGKRKRKTIYGKTRREVAEKLKVVLREQQQGLPVAIERQTVAQFLDRWLADDVKPTKAPKTYASYAETVRVHLNPTLGRVPLAKLSPQDVQMLLSSKTAAGLSPTTVRYIRTILRIALGRAEKWGMVARNVAAVVDPPRVVRTEVHPLTVEEARVFLAAVEGDRLETLYRLTISLGLRMGEVLGLAWDDVDLGSGTVRVRRALQRVDGRLILKEPKTERSRRTLTLPATLAASLRAHRVRQAEERLKLGPHWVDIGLVFTTPLGTPLEPSNVLKRFKVHLAGAGLPKQRFHDLRHCAASLLIAQLVPIEVVRSILGHAHISTTLDIYAHILPDAHREAAEQMDAILTGTG